MEPEVLKEAESRQKQILDADYLQVDIDTHVQELNHLSTDEKSQLTSVLKSHPTLFGGGLGILKVRPISLELEPGAKPYHAKPYPVPQAYKGTTKREIQCLCDLVLIRDPGLAESRYPASAIQPYSVHAGQQSGSITFEPCYLDMQHAWPTASLQPLLQAF
jgi:hypothetical protein